MRRNAATKHTKTIELWRQDNLSGRRAFLAGPADELARDIIDEGGALAWHANGLKDPLSQMAAAFGFDGFYKEALVKAGFSLDEDGEPFNVMCHLADDVAVRAYLLGVAVGRRLHGNQGGER